MKSCFFILAIFAALSVYAQNNDLKLWYKAPACSTWENALPIGNGRIGAMVYGNVATEIIQLNEATFWSGEPNRNDNPLALDSLGAIRKLIYEGRQKEAERPANKTIVSKKSQGQMFEPSGELHLSFSVQNAYTNYYRADIKSNLEGNPRIRVPNEMKELNGRKLRPATGDNSNPFYRTERTKAPLVSPKAVITAPVLKETCLYDIVTRPGEIVNLITTEN